jgi:putative pyruvate formate lyase activating enzyme
MMITKAKVSYLNLTEQEFSDRVDGAYDLMIPACRVCPRACGVNRVEGERGLCGADERCFVSSSSLHFGEEPPLSGWSGSGTLFLTRCNLKCVYCQNYPISQLGNGVETGPDELAGRMVHLQREGAHNINWVTPTHEVPHLLDGLKRARHLGLKIPIVYNSSGYDSLDALKLLDGIVDIYLPDMRYADGNVSLKYSGAGDYPRVNRKAIREMHRQVGDLILDSKGIAMRGLLVRHLILPRGISGTAEIMQFLSEEISEKTAVSLMSQYFPAHEATRMEGVGRRITREEYLEARKILERYGLTEGWHQEI